MRRLAIPAAAIASAVFFAAVALAADRTGTLTEAAPAYTWSGPPQTAHSAGFYGYVGEPCTKTPAAYCDETLFEVTLPPGTERGSISVAVKGAGDFDLYLYSSDAEGATGTQLKYSNTPGTGGESVGYNLTQSGWYLAKVVYYDTQDAGYEGRAELHLPGSTLIEPTPTPTSTPATTESPAGPPAEPTPAPSPAQPRSASAPPPLPRLTHVRRHRRAVTGRLQCEIRCMARATAGRAGRAGRASVRVASGDTVEFRIPLRRRAPRRVDVRLNVRDSLGRQITLGRRAT